MPPRKPLHPDCIGGIHCPAPGHVKAVLHANGRFTLKHAPLTDGQRRTIRERKRH